MDFHLVVKAPALATLEVPTYLVGSSQPFLKDNVWSIKRYSVL